MFHKNSQVFMYAEICAVIYWQNLSRWILGSSQCKALQFTVLFLPPGIYFNVDWNFMVLLCLYV